MNTTFFTQRPLLWSYTGYQLDLELSTLIDTFKILHGLAPSYLLSFISFRRPSRYKLRSSNDNLLLSYSLAPGGGGGYFRNFWVRMCRWHPGTPNLYQS